jgi:hypothetical protein
MNLGGNRNIFNANALASTFAIRTSPDTKQKLQKSLQANAQGDNLGGHTLTERSTNR